MAQESMYKKTYPKKHHYIEQPQGFDNLVIFNFLRENHAIMNLLLENKANYMSTNLDKQTPL